MAKYRMEEPNSPFMFQVGDRIITLNCPRPYSGWTDFRKEILALVKIVVDSGLVPAPLRHSLRYIDLLTLDPAPDLSSLQLSSTLGTFDLHAKPLQMRVELPDERCTHVVQIATPAQVMFPEGKKVGSIVDIESFYTESSTDWKMIATQIDHLHKRSHVLFFESILTQTAIELMEPEY